jgi:hypothetical protein
MAKFWHPTGGKMTDIDLHADIEIQRHDDHVTVRIPLAGEVSQQWHRRYQALARARKVPARVEELPDRNWIVVNVPASIDRPDVLTLMEACGAGRRRSRSADPHDT